MLWFIFFQFMLSLFLTKLYGSMNGVDLYRSLNCMSLSSRGMYCLYKGSTKKSIILTCNMFISYNIVDIYILYKNKVRRIELWCHHIFTLFCYIYLLNSNSYNECFVGHLVLIAELLSIFNSILRNNINYLKYWRVFILLCIRLPIWIFMNYLIYYTDLLDHSIKSQILYKNASIIMPLIDVNLLYKILKKR